MRSNGFQLKIGGFPVISTACPLGTVTMHHFTDGHILAKAETLFS